MRVSTASRPILGVRKSEATAELVAFATTSKTGRRAVATLLRHYRRSQQTHPNSLPIVKLVSGSFRHEKFGDVLVPRLEVIGMRDADGTAKSNGLNTLPEDDIPF
jgi:hypothetical protein